MSGKFNFAIDRGGTFTDVFAICPTGKQCVMKLLSVSPNYPDAPTEGIRRILEQETGRSFQDTLIDSSLIGWIRMGTTVATNALLEKKGAKVVLVTNRGMRDLLVIGDQARPKLFELNVTPKDSLYEEILEVDTRLVPCQDNDQLFNEDKYNKLNGVDGEIFDRNKIQRLVGVNGKSYYHIDSFNEAEFKSQLSECFERGICSVAIVLMHSYAVQEQELRLGRIAQDLGFNHVSLSHQVMPMVKIVPRGNTTVIDAYLTPHIKQYLTSFCKGFENNLEGVNVLFMQSDGGLTPMDSFIGSRAILSGPAGGLVGYATTSPTSSPVIGFDMGGTSTDVSRYYKELEHVFESTIAAGITVQIPQLDIQTVAAGGGSMLFFRSGLFVAGPESAGAWPGPRCYRNNGPLTITDCNLVLGRIIPEYFPSIFGPNKDQPLDAQGTREAFEVLRQDINKFYQDNDINKTLSVEQVALGFINVADETMCRPIRAVTQARGYDTQDHILACFGGAGGQHACAVARSLGIRSVYTHKYAGILSAYGMACADIVHEVQEPCGKLYKPDDFDHFVSRLVSLSEQTISHFTSQGYPLSSIRLVPYLHMRFLGTEGSLMCGPEVRVEPSQETDLSELYRTRLVPQVRKIFLERYKEEYGFVLNKDIAVDDLRVRGLATLETTREPLGKTTCPAGLEPGVPTVKKVSTTYFQLNGECTALPTNIYDYSALCPNHRVLGPAIIMNELSTILIEPNCEAVINDKGDIEISVDIKSASCQIDTQLDPIQLSIFSHRFMSIAEQMGRVLQRTAHSTNIKERLDFSCALFGPDGGLVSNAPHIPVHLGSMQEAVKFQIDHRKGQFKKGSVILSNHPKAGGSHLPDLTVITPVFIDSEPAPVFFVANRGHHADIGGLTPGSMPPHSKKLTEEGAVFESFDIVLNNEFQEEAVTAQLMEPAKYPGCSGTRNLPDNLADLKAQIAANQKGISLVQDVINLYSLPVVQAYMKHIQTNAELSVRDLLKQVALKYNGESLIAEDFMDDGSRIALVVNIDALTGSALFDFSYSEKQVMGNCNAPKSITKSAVMYCLRCMVGYDIPLNQGCLAPITIKLTPGSILNPTDQAAVVGGNVQTSQRVVDVILRAFGVAASSQGCMNNITLGDETWGYYETVGGGAGAGPYWHGRPGVHSHMTNTRITDAEILESRYPILLNRFGLRAGSGGGGKYWGGDGMVREYVFRRGMTLCMLTERRVFWPRGLNGGSPGARGFNLLLSNSEGGLLSRLASKSSVQVQAGDIFCLYTPGGGGYGAPPGSTIVPPGEDDSSRTRRKYERLMAMKTNGVQYPADLETFLQ
uniref:5-oxoprolinase n=1 Tax=Cacopsylla melanoneura TaxID=428564 RepID=A0A8D9F168_9HEMI